MGDQYYRFFPGDYLRDTGDLTLLEHGAYMIMLHHYYTAESLPIEKERLYRICRAFTKPEQQAIDIVVERYFRENGNGHLVNRRAEKELAERKAFKESQSEKGKRSAEKRWGKKDNQEVTTVTSRLQPNVNLPSPSPSPSLIPSPKKVKTLFVDTSDEVRLSESLFERIRHNNPKAKKPNMQVWAKQVDLMIRVDHRTPDDIQALIDWCQEDEFWKLNILSTTKLREKFDQLWLKMTNGGKRYGNTSNGGGHDSPFLRALREADERKPSGRMGGRPESVQGRRSSEGGTQGNGGVCKNADAAGCDSTDDDTARFRKR